MNLCKYITIYEDRSSVYKNTFALVPFAERNTNQREKTEGVSENSIN